MDEEEFYELFISEQLLDCRVGEPNRKKLKMIDFARDKLRSMKNRIEENKKVEDLYSNTSVTLCIPFEAIFTEITQKCNPPCENCTCQ